jgi:hypothetical protein
MSRNSLVIGLGFIDRWRGYFVTIFATSGKNTAKIEVD